MLGIAFGMVGGAFAWCLAHAKTLAARLPPTLCAHRRYGSYAVSDSARTHPYWLRSLRLWQLADVLYCLRRGLPDQHG